MAHRTTLWRRAHREEDRRAGRLRYASLKKNPEKYRVRLGKMRVYDRARKAETDPNIKRDSEREKRFRFGRELPIEIAYLRLKSVPSRTIENPEFVFVEPSGKRRRERIDSIERFAERVKSRMRLAEKCVEAA